jgi:hypothetical protein
MTVFFIHSKFRATFLMTWFLFLFGFLIGLILLYFFKRLNLLHRYNRRLFFPNIFSLEKHEEEKFSSINSSKIWMYELREENYNPHTFSLSMTNICLIEIQNNILFLFQPSKEPDHKLNDYELHSNVSFNQIRIYNLNKAIVGLLPTNMISSKYWSKKSPIVLKNILHLRNEFVETSEINPPRLSNKIHVRETLFLFTRTRRSKEDWFYRFVNASKFHSWRKEIYYQLEQHFREKKKIPSLSNPKRQYCEQWLMEHNQKNMSKKKVTHSDRDLNTNRTETELSQSSLQTNLNQGQYKTHSLLFFLFKYLQNLPDDTIENNNQNPIFLINIFAARCFLDVFDNEQYLQRIQTFLQKQLQKIKIPFIEHIIITNLNLGDRFPEIKVNIKT